MMQDKYKQLLNMPVREWLDSLPKSSTRTRLSHILLCKEEEYLTYLYGDKRNDWYGYDMKLRDVVKLTAEKLKENRLCGKKTVDYLVHHLQADNLHLCMTSIEIENLTGEKDEKPFPPNKAYFDTDFNPSEAMVKLLNIEKYMRDAASEMAERLHESIFSSCLEIAIKKLSKCKNIRYEGWERPGNRIITMRTCDENKDKITMIFQLKHDVYWNFITLCLNGSDRKKQRLQTLGNIYLPQFHRHYEQSELSVSLSIHCHQYEKIAAITDGLIAIAEEYYRC